MKKLFLSVIWSCYAALSFASTVQPQAIQDLLHQSYQDLNGQTVSLAGIQQPILINFWASWCTNCLQEMDDLNRLQQDYPQLKVIGIALDEKDNVQPFIKKHPVKYQIVIGTDKVFSLMRPLGDQVRGLPYSLLLSPQQTVWFQQVGVLNFADLRKILQEKLVKK